MTRSMQWPSLKACTQRERHGTMVGCRNKEHARHGAWRRACCRVLVVPDPL